MEANPRMKTVHVSGVKCMCLENVPHEAGFHIDYTLDFKELSCYIALGYISADSRSNSTSDQNWRLGLRWFLRSDDRPKKSI